MGMMLFRLVLSLLFVGFVLWFAHRVAKKRGLGGRHGLIEVLDRQPMSRTSAVTVIRVAGKVMVVGSTETQITMLGDIDADAVQEHLDRAEADAALSGAALSGAAPAKVPVTGSGVASGSVFDRRQWAALIEALRERTVRR